MLKDKIIVHLLNTKECLLFVQLIVTTGRCLAARLLFIALQTFGCSPKVMNNTSLETQGCGNAAPDTSQVYAE